MQNPHRVGWRRNRGVTIVEALVALTVLSFGLYSAAELVSASRRNGQMASWRAEAAGLAALKLEELRLAAPAVEELLRAQGEGKPLVFPVEKRDKIFAQNKRLSWTATVTRPADDAARLDIRVEVTRTAGTDGDVPIVSQGPAFLPGWPSTPEKRM